MEQRGCVKVVVGNENRSQEKMKIDTKIESIESEQDLLSDH